MFTLVWKINLQIPYSGLCNIGTKNSVWHENLRQSLFPSVNFSLFIITISSFEV